MLPAAMASCHQQISGPRAEQPVDIDAGSSFMLGSDDDQEVEYEPQLLLGPEEWPVQGEHSSLQQSNTAHMGDRVPQLCMQLSHGVYILCSQCDLRPALGTWWNSHDLSLLVVCFIGCFQTVCQQ